MKPIFRNSMFGFNKEDVFNFITKQNKQYEAKISELTAEKERLAADCEKERESFSRDTEELEVLRRKNEQIQDLLKNIRHSISLILEDKARILECNVSCEEELGTMKDRMNEMQSRVAEAEVLREKAVKFQQLSDALSSILLDKNKDEIAMAEEAVLPSFENVTAGECSTESFRTLNDLMEKLSAHCDELSKYTETETDDE